MEPTTNTPTHASEPALYSVEAAAQRLSLPRTALYTLLMSGRLVSIKVGRHRLVPAWAIEDFIQKTADEQRITPRDGGA